MDGGVKGVKNKLVIIAVTYGIGNNTLIFEIENCAEVQLAIISILKLRNIREPLLIEPFGGKIVVQDILRRYLRR